MNSPAPRFDLPLRRHQLVRIHPAAWDALLASRVDLSDEPLLREWVRNGWPLIVRRPMLDEVGGLSLGLPLPPSAGKQRIAVQLQSDDVLSVGSLPSLHSVMQASPNAWLPCLRELDGFAKTYGVQAGVFGSLAWQWLTGLHYLGSNSDIDIAWTLPSRDRIEPFLDDLADIESRAPMRLDGELIRHDGTGVNWREVQGGHADLALKTATEVVMCSREAFIGELA
jgi:phosphoribosyl-dephospho-CoA transferase